MIQFVFWDVQHGHGMYLKTLNKHIVFDLGAGSYGTNKEFSPLLHLKNKYKVQQLDGVVITHPHRDHLDDIANFDALSPRCLWRPNHLTEEDVRKANRDGNKTIIDKYLEINKRYTRPIADNENPLKAENNGGVNVKMFVPKNCAKSNINNHSIVTVISHESVKMLIPGDNEPACWNELLADDAFVSAIDGAHIILAPHHGRESGFSDSLFEKISPYLVIVSDGRFCDTSATDRYSKKAKGWNVKKRNGETKERKCITTRNDGVILVEFGKNDNGKAYMEVTID